MTADYSWELWRLRLPSTVECAIISFLMSNLKTAVPKARGVRNGQELISLAQKLARDAERHAILSASLASQADRLMHAGLRLLDMRKAQQES
jgi:hypothetical protein